ncbi:Na+/H+ antiporter subunit A [Bacillaceae bacterium S4-13-58]
MIFFVLLPIMFAFLVPIISKWKHKIHTGWLVLVIPIIIFTYFIRFVGSDFVPISQSFPWIPSLHINFDMYIDGLSLLFVLLISGIGSLVVLYSIYYLNKDEQLKQFYIYLLLFMAAMLGIALSDNVYVLYTFWELTSLSSFLLIGYWHNRERSRYGALKSMLITVLGGLSLLGAFITLSVITGTTSIRVMIENSDKVLTSPFLGIILVFLFLGAFTKSAQFPFHIWLPDAMEAPTPVSAYLHSATMVKAGIYLIARFSPLFAASEWYFMVVSTVGLITLCWGSYMAVRQTDLKAILAFSTISQLGMIMAMLGYGTEAALFAAVFHILNHATFKGSLFMVAGIVDHETGTRDIRKLGGLMALMPITGVLALFGTFSMAGFPLPFLNGFYSKELFFESSLHIGHFENSYAALLANVTPIIAVLGSIFTFVYSMYLFFGTFRGKLKVDELPQKPHEAPIGMLISPILLVFGVIIIGLFPNLFNKGILSHAASAILGGGHVEEKIYFWHGWDSPAFQMSLLVVGLGTLLFLTRKKWRTIYRILPGNVSFNQVYDGTIKRSETYSAAITNSYMTGSLGLYIRLILSTIFFITGGVLLYTNGINLNVSEMGAITAPEILVALVMIIASFGTIFARNRIAAILILGVVGYGISLLFVFFRAPDLALTQLIIETVTVALFLLSFHHLPQLEKTTERPIVKSANIFISVAFGLLMGIIGLSAHNSKWFKPISEYFIETSHELGGGDNVVNVILVDMRGLDTLFEISVLGLAALGIYGLLKLGRKREAE